MFIDMVVDCLSANLSNGYSKYCRDPGPGYPDLCIINICSVSDHVTNPALHRQKSELADW